MNKFKLYFIFLIASGTIFSCKNDDDPGIVIPPPRDYSVQYLVDIDSIEGYLKTHYLTQIGVGGQIDIEITKIPSPNPDGLVSIWNNTDFVLKSKIVKNDLRSSNLIGGRVEDPVDYKMYYLILNEGGGLAPTTTDSTYTAYKGWTLDNKVFDSSNIPFWSTYPSLAATETGVISGFRQFMPELKSATSSIIENDGSVTFQNSGVGVVFIPSGIGYFNNPTAIIPAYSPLVFRIRLHAIRNRDHDRDGIISRNEDLDNDGDVFNDDSDGDTIPNFLDVDDDADNFLTKSELKYTDTNGDIQYYDFNSIPLCTGGNGKKRHLDPLCHTN